MTAIGKYVQVLKTAETQVQATFRVILGDMGLRYRFRTCDSYGDCIDTTLHHGQTSIFVNASPDLPQLSTLPSSGIYELRTYQLVLGYDTVPQFCQIYVQGLADKMAADTTGQSQLKALLSSEAGAAQLNTVLELWRHESIDGSQESRAASRHALKWRAAVQQIARLAVRFDTQLLAPLP